MSSHEHFHGFFRGPTGPLAGACARLFWDHGSPFTESVHPAGSLQLDFLQALTSRPALLTGRWEATPRLVLTDLQVQLTLVWPPLSSGWGRVGSHA